MLQTFSPLVADQGSTRVFDITVRNPDETPTNLTGCVVRAQVRTTYSASSTVVNATLANGKLTIVNAVGGLIRWTLAPDDTAGKPIFKGDDDTVELVYDVEVQDPAGVVFKPIRGTLTLNREVTR